MGSLPLVPTLRLRVSEKRQGPARERRSGQARQLAFPAGYRLLGSEEGEKSILRRDAARGRPMLPPAMEPWEPECSAFSLSQPNLSQLASAKERANSLDALHATPSVCVCLRVWFCQRAFPGMASLDKTLPVGERVEKECQRSFFPPSLIPFSP